VFAAVLLLPHYQSARADVTGGPGEAERHQSYFNGAFVAPDLATVWAGWPFTVEAPTCDGHHSDYCIRVEAPRLNEGGGYDPNYRSELWLCVRRANYGSGATNHVYSWCKWCPNNVGKTGFHDTFNGNSGAIIHHDSVNNRWGMYVAGKWVRTIDDADAMMDAGDFLWVGGTVSNDRSVLGPFAHQAVWVDRISAAYSEVFVPTDTSGQVPHKRDGETNTRFWSQYSVDGSVGVFTAGEADCP